jgi:hypothetical protein
VPASQCRPEKLGKYTHRTSRNESGCSTIAIQLLLQQKQQHWARSVHFKRGQKMSQEGKIRLQHLTFTIFFFFWFSIHTYLFFFLPFFFSGFLNVTSIHPCVAFLFLLAKFVGKAKLKTKNSLKKVILQVFSREKREGKKT